MVGFDTPSGISSAIVFYFVMLAISGFANLQLHSRNTRLQISFPINDFTRGRILQVLNETQLELKMP